MQLPTIPGIETFWRLKGRSVDGKEEIFTNQDATITEETDQSCSWKFSGGMEVRLWRDDSGFHLAFAHCPDKVKIREMQFPVWHLESPDLRLLLPKSTGFMTGPTGNWAEKAELSCSFSSYQMAACFGTDHNILVMLPDEEHYLKNIKVCRTGEHVEAAVHILRSSKRKRLRLHHSISGDFGRIYRWLVRSSRALPPFCLEHKRIPESERTHQPFAEYSHVVLESGWSG